MYLDISVNELKNKLNGGINIIDIRPSTKYKISHIPNSINISKNELMFNTEKHLNKSITYYIYCEKGVQSRGLCKYLSSVGYKVVDVKGGYESYSK